jgi:hypothetical protein
VLEEGTVLGLILIFFSREIARCIIILAIAGFFLLVLLGRPCYLSFCCKTDGALIFLLGESFCSFQGEYPWVFLFLCEFFFFPLIFLPLLSGIERNAKT